MSFGEVISEDIIKKIDEFTNKGIEVIGLLEDEIEVVK